MKTSDWLQPIFAEDDRAKAEFDSWQAKRTEQEMTPEEREQVLADLRRGAEEHQRMMRAVEVQPRETTDIAIEKAVARAVESRAEWQEFATGLFYGDQQRGRQFLKAMKTMFSDYTARLNDSLGRVVGRTIGDFWKAKRVDDQLREINRRLNELESRRDTQDREVNDG
jgi:hypothetical protein